MQDVHEGAARPVRGTYSLIAWLCALVGLAAAVWPDCGNGGGVSKSYRHCW